MRRLLSGASTVVAVGALLATSLTVSAFTPSGAIFTTLANGSEINLNQFPSKEAVYLDGGPGPGAPQTAAGLDDGTYVFQVTDPSGKRLLSSDNARCRQVVVTGGIITSVVPVGGCQHLTGNDVDHNALTVQLMPYDNTPNNGGVYKAWVERVEDFVINCQALGFANGLDRVDCGDAPGNRHGFVPSNSKTDNFKIKNERRVREIDTIFWHDTNGDGFLQSSELLTGLTSKWTDTQGVTNNKHSYFVPQFSIVEAHVEAVEDGIHYITIPDLSAQGCVVGGIFLDHLYARTGPGTLAVDMSNISNGTTDVSRFVQVNCL